MATITATTTAPAIKPTMGPAPKVLVESFVSDIVGSGSNAACEGNRMLKIRFAHANCDST